MRPVSELSTSGDGTLDGLLEDTVLEFIDADTETNVDLKSQTTFCTETNMAAVFPTLASSYIGATAATKIGAGSKVETKSEPAESFSGSASSISKSLVAVKEKQVLVGSTGESVGPRNNNNRPIYEIRNNESQNGSHDSKKRVELKERPPSGFNNTVVEALIEKQKAGETNKTGDKFVRNISDRSDVGVSDNEDFCGKGCGLPASDYSKFATQMIKLPPCPSSGTSCSRTEASANEVTGAVKTRACQGDSLSCSVDDRSLATFSEQGGVGDECSALSPEGAQSLSPVVDLETPTTTNCSEKPLTQKNTSQPPDDAITAEAASGTPRSHKLDKTASTCQDGAGEGKQRLSARISKRLVNFFQRRMSKRPTLPDSTSTERQGQTSYTAAETTHGKDEARHSSFAGKLKTSVGEWRRKHPNRTKSLSREGKGTGPDTEDKNESQNNNKGRVPLFVSPHQQADIVEDAPDKILDEQKLVLRESWLIIKSDVEEVGVEAFMGLFHTHPDSIDSFMAFKDKSIEDIEKSAVLKAHALRVMQTVDKCITRIDDMDKMSAVLCQLGGRHIGYRANASLVPMIGKQFISAIEPKMGDKWSDEVRDSWDALFRNINYHLRRGMMKEKLRLKEEGVIGKRK